MVIEFQDNLALQDSTMAANPKKYPFLDSLNLSKDVINRLSIQLDGVVRGSSVVLTTPLCKEISPDEILAKWDKIYKANEHKVSDRLKSLELTNRSKFGPRSIAKPWKLRKDSLMSYFGADISTPGPQSVASRLPYLKGNLRPISKSRALALCKNQSNSGLPYYVKKGKVKDLILPNWNDLILRDDPCILFTRTQEGNKTRDVWGYPFVRTVMEMTFYNPLLMLQKTLPWRAALIGPDEVDARIIAMMRRKPADHLLLSTDFESFDKSVLLSLQEASCTYIKRAYQSQYSLEIDEMFKKFNTIGILTPDGVLSGSHGVPSGSTFTNEVDSIAQYLVAKSAGLKIDDNEIQIQGDDGLYLLRGQTDVDTLINVFIRNGLKVNDQKSDVSSDYCIYLQKLYDLYYINQGVSGGIYPVYRALNRLLFQERWSEFEDYGLSGNDYYSLRAISILENCKHHPLFREFVLFIKEIDKYSLKFSSKSVFNFNQLVENRKGASEVITNQYGDKVKGLLNFDTIKILNY